MLEHGLSRSEFFGDVVDYGEALFYVFFKCLPLNEEGQVGSSVEIYR